MPNADGLGREPSRINVTNSRRAIDFARMLTYHKAITTYLPRIIEQVNTLAQLVADHKGEPVYINDVMSWFSFDSMGEFMFNESFGMMKSSEWHPAIVQQRGALALLAPMGQAIWIVRLAFAFVPWFGKVREWFQMVAFCDKQMEKRISVSLRSACLNLSMGPFCNRRRL